MNTKEKIKTYKEQNIAEWINSVNEACGFIDDRYPVFCPCGKLATGLHISHCSKYRKLVETEAVRIFEQRNHIK